MHPQTANHHTNLLWLFFGLIFCALFLVFSLPKGIQVAPTGAVVSMPAASQFSSLFGGFGIALILIAFAVLCRKR
ncbi:MAG: hypothetical protein QW165_01030 [Candidatus Woesearchaeota archaeon]